MKFGGGRLGHLDAGGHFYVKQEEVQPGYLELTVLDVDMKGKALFLKTIGVQEEIKRSMLRRVRDDLTAAQCAVLLYQQVRTTSGVRDVFPKGAYKNAYKSLPVMGNI